MRPVMQDILPLVILISEKLHCDGFLPCSDSPLALQMAVLERIAYINYTASS